MAYQTPETGRASFPTKVGSCGGKLRPFIEQKAVDHPVKGGRTAIDLKRDPGAHGYPDPAKLPTRPAALLNTLNRAAVGGHWDTGTLSLADGAMLGPDGPRNAIVFWLIERLLQVPIRPALRAALFEVTGQLHGITLDHTRRISSAWGWDLASVPDQGLAEC
jgi:hypothetical protein